MYEDLKKPNLFDLDFLMKMLIFFPKLFELVFELSGLFIPSLAQEPQRGDEKLT